ncbi:MAG: hypothetical protein J4G11_11015 [Acidimicrobiia bacterium]|nr:hypothetical protein [Acidimicrobiia bacterium]
MREAVANALAHRDYGLVGATVDVTVWDDRVEVTSPGPLPGHITSQNMRTEHYSRNRRIMGVLKTIGRGVRRGRGSDVPGDGVSSHGIPDVRSHPRLGDRHLAQPGTRGHRRPDLASVVQGSRHDGGRAFSSGDGAFRGLGYPATPPRVDG